MPVAGVLSAKVYPDTKVFGQSLQRYLDRVEKTLRVEIPALIDGKNIISEAREIAREAERASRIVLDVGVEGATEHLRADLAAQVRLAEKLAPKITIKTDVDRGSLRRVISALGAITPAVAKVGLIGVAAASSAVGVGKLLAALAPASGALIALPAVAVGAAAGVGVLKLALSGMGDALSAGLSGDTQKFTESLKGMAPAAQQTARAIVGLKPQLDGLRKSVQASFFSGFSFEINALATSYLPLLRQALPKVSGELNLLTRSIAGAAEQGPLLGGVRSVLDNLAAGLARASENAPALVDALGRLLTVGAPALRTVGGLVGTATGRLAEFISNAADSGKLAGYLSSASVVLHQIGATLGNIGAIFSTVVSAAGGGGGLLGTFSALTGSVATFLQSSQGMSLLSTIFATLGSVADSVRTALGALLPALGAGLAAAAPAATQFVQALAGGLVTLAPKLVPLGAILGQVLAALTPLLPAVSSLVSSGLGILLPVVSTLVGVLRPLIAIVAESPKLFLALGVAITIWANATKIAAIATRAYAAVQTVLNIVLSANPIGLIIIAIAALVGVIIYAWKNSDTFRKVVTGAWEAIKTAFSATVAFLGGVFSAIGTFFANLGRSIGSFFTETIPGWFNTVVGFFAALPGRIGAALAALPGLLLNAIKTGIDGMLFMVGFGIGLVLRFFIDLPGRVWSLLTSLWSGAVSIVSAGVSAVVGFFAALPGRVVALVRSLWSQANALFQTGVALAIAYASALPGRISAYFSDLWSRAKSLFSSGVDAVVGFMRELPGKAASAVSSLGSRIVSAVSGAIDDMKSVGRNIIMGMVDGIKGAVGAAVEAVKHAVGQVVAGAKKGLGINSPSTVFRDEVGRWIPAGVAEGIDRYAHLATDAVAQLGQITAAGISVAVPAGGAPGTAGAQYVTNIYPQRADFTADDLSAVMSRQASLSRAGRVA